jgi:hypothetical protein
MMRCAACLHDNRAAVLLLEEWKQLAPSQFAPELHFPGLVDSVDLKDRFGGIQADHGNAHGGRLPFYGRDNPYCGTQMPSGGRPPHLYGLRFKIEFTFKQAVHQIGSFAYHFWMQRMTPVRRNSGNQHLHRATPKYRDEVRRKFHAYHVFIHAGVICQGLLQYLAVAFPQIVWNSFGSWLRTIRPGIPPSELVVATALRQRLPEFLLNSHQTNIFAKFIADRQDSNNMHTFRLAA